MKKLYFLLLVSFLFGSHLWAQTTEHFETEVIGSTTFTDNGRTFTITSQAGGIFDIEGNYPNTGFQGSGDHRYIDNSDWASNFTPTQFTISSGSAFQLKSMYLFLSRYDLNLNVSGVVTITGKLGGAVVFTASSSSGFNNGYATNNGFTFINMSTYGGANNSNALIDQFVVATTSGIHYVGLDGMTWQIPACPAITLSQTSQTNISCNGGSNGAATVSASGGSGYTYNWTPGNPSGDGTATATGLTAGNWTVTVTSSCGSTASTTFNITQPATLSSTQSQTNVSCNGGSNGTATISATGGSGSYSYFWSPNVSSGATATGLPAGNYSVTVTDANGCTTSKNFTITQPTTAVSATQSQTNVSCSGGSNGTATVVASGGTGSYLYSWSPSGGTGATASGLSAGNYTVTITDSNSCSIQRSFTITQPATGVTATQSQTNVNCNGGSNGTATVVASGGTGSYSYSWSPSGGTGATATGLSAGNYTVTIIDANSCSIQKSFTISAPDALTATQSQTNVSCNGGSNGTATVVASGGTGSYSYSWSPSGGTGATASGLSAGNYTVTITDANSCSIQKSFAISAPDALTATQSQTNVSCNGGSNGTATVVASGGTGSYSYSWSPSGGTGATASGLSAGNYTVTIIDANSCSIQKNFTISAPDALTATQSQTNVSCGGGSNGTATVVASGGTGSYSYSWSPSGGTGATASGLSAGDYTVTISDANSCSIQKNFIITSPEALTATQSQTNISCNGDSNGTATVVASGGTGSYSYLWSPSGGTGATATGLTAGDYTVTITDASSCSIQKNFTIGTGASCSTTMVLSVNPTVLFESAATTCSVSGISLGTATASDYCSEPTISNNAPTEFPIGATTVTWTATDACGNTATATQTVVVSDTGIPTITAPADITICQGEVITLGTPTVTDNCSNVSIYNNAPEAFPLGTTTVLWFVLDASGNEASTTQTVTVNPNITYYADADGDGFGNAAVSTSACNGTPSGYVTNSTDCNDASNQVNPGHAEVLYNGIDDNCDGQLDEGFQIKTQLYPQYCGITLNQIYQGLAVNYQIANVTAYRFRIRNQTNPAEPVQYLERSYSSFKFTDFARYDYGATYLVDAMIQRNGVWLGYYGNACSVTTPAVPQLQNCGGTVAAKGTFIFSQVKQNITGYRFEVIRLSTGQIAEVNTGAHYFSF
ncbi:MAG TPA: HYR domain-containing protein, partial [Flavobacterium sp.]